MVKKSDRREQRYSRRSFLSTALAVPILVAGFPSPVQPSGFSASLSNPAGAFVSGDIKVVSPNGNVQFHLTRRNVAVDLWGMLTALPVTGNIRFYRLRNQLILSGEIDDKDR